MTAIARSLTRVTHVKRAAVANRNHGQLTVRAALASTGIDEAWINRFESAAGRAVAKAYRTAHHAEPATGAIIRNGRIWRVMRYGAADLLAGLVSYKRFLPELLALAPAPVFSSVQMPAAAPAPAVEPTPANAWAVYVTTPGSRVRRNLTVIHLTDAQAEALADRENALQTWIRDGARRVLTHFAADTTEDGAATRHRVRLTDPSPAVQQEIRQQLGRNLTEARTLATGLDLAA